MFVIEILDIAREKLVTTTESIDVVEVARLLVTGTDIVLVCDTLGALQGVITKTDVVRQLSDCQGVTCMCLASTMMTRNVALCRKEDLLDDVAKLMKDLHLKNVPVVDADNRPIGVLTTQAVLRVLLGEVEHDEARLIEYVKGIGYR